MKHTRASFWVWTAVLFGLGWSLFLPAQTTQEKTTWDGSRTTAVHWLQLKDEFDQIIVPSDSYALPYSTKFTCAPCHDYTVIKEGLHFNALSSTQHGRPGEPWIWADPKTGIVLPLSYRDWTGVWNPEDLDLTPWDFTLLFGRHMTGGGIAEPKDGELSPESRWEVSGKLEINCMGCHNASRLQSHSEWAKQVLRHNFRWAATASSGLGEVGGMASRLPGTWDLFDGPNPDDTEWAVVPTVRYRPSQFDSKQRVFFDIPSAIDDQRCLACHSVTRVGETRLTAHQDIHSAAGIGCVDCHRNDIGHNMTRGYEKESEEYQDERRGEFSCWGCHMDKDLSKRGSQTAGRLGAPYPEHSGIPAVHFERLSCTVCHSGPLPSKESTRIKTSRGNRLGIYGVAQWSTQWPHIVEPVFVRDRSDKITPNRLMWPAFWGKQEGENIKPLRPSDVQKVAGEILMVQENIVEVLKAISLYGEIEGVPVLVLSGSVYEPNVDGLLDVSPYSGEEVNAEISWAIKTDGGILPLIPEFDPDAEEPDVDAETRIQNVLIALSTMEKIPGQPGIIYKRALYHLPEGYLEKEEGSEEGLATAKIVWLKDDESTPVVSDFQVRSVVATVGSEQTLTEEQVALVLQSFAQNDTGEFSYVYVSGGKVFELDEEGELTNSKHPAAEPVVWPLGHRVRPAQQSLGINGCMDCHSENSAFFFGKITGSGPLKTDGFDERSAFSLMNLDKPYQKLFGLSFRVRPLLKGVLFVAAAFVGSVLFIMLMVILGRHTGLFEKRR
ncbi:MAG: hypothetical protein JSV17_17190 [Candidatus Aminicenantes bacterium]|nr:MAG: hypothetical protein JSV17_17190 [Candidatus Aminicenantes bacterium]